MIKKENISKDIKFKYIINNQYIRRYIFKHVHLIHSIIEPKSVLYSWQDLLENEYQLSLNGYTKEFIQNRQNENQYISDDHGIFKKRNNISKYLYIASNVAARTGNIELLEYLLENGEFFNGLELSIAIKYQQFHLVDFFLAKFGSKQILHQALMACAKYGNLETMKKINEYCSEHYDWGLITDTAFRHSFEMGKWLFETRKHMCSTDGTSILLELNDINIVRWLVDNKFPFSIRSMSIAARLGNYEICMIIKTKCYGRYKGSLIEAAKHNHQRLIRHIRAEKMDRFTKNIVSYIAGNGNLCLLEEIGGPRLQYCGKLALSRAAENNHFHIVNRLLDIDYRMTCLPKHLCNVAMNGHIEMLQLLYNHQQNTFTSEIVNHVAINSGPMAVLECLMMDFLLDPTFSGFGQTAVNGHLKHLKFLYRSSVRPMYCPFDKLEELVYTNHSQVLRWLLKKDLFLQGGMILPKVIIHCQSLDMINLLLNQKEKFKIDCTASVLHLLLDQRLDVVDLLLESHGLINDSNFANELKDQLVSNGKTLHRLSVRSLRYFIRRFGELKQIKLTDINKMINSNNLDLMHFCLENVKIEPKADIRSVILANRTLPFLRYYLEYIEEPLAHGFELDYAEDGDLCLLAYLLHRLGTLSSADKALEFAIHRDNNEVVRFLYENTSARPSIFLVSISSIKLNRRMVRYLYFQGKDSSDPNNIDKKLKEFQNSNQLSEYAKDRIQQYLKTAVVNPLPYY